MLGLKVLRSPTVCRVRAFQVDLSYFKMSSTENNIFLLDLKQFKVVSGTLSTFSKVPVLEGSVQRVRK